MKYKEAQAELKSACQLYGPAEMWDLVVKEQAAARMRQQEAIEAQARQRDKIFWGLSVILGVIIFVAGFVGMVYFARCLLSYFAATSNLPSQEMDAHA